MAEPLIEFHAPADMLERLPPPLPAARCIPDWLNNMPTHAASASSSPPAIEPPLTVKSCMPFREAMALGYILPAPAAITFIMEGQSLRVEVADFCVPLVERHSGDQLPGAPYSGSLVVKFHTPWLIRTPPGYSTLMLPPLNRFDMPFHALCGVVETDSYYLRVAFPMLCTLRPGERFTLARGAPLIQLVPFLREAWTSQVGPSHAEANAAQDRQLKADRHMYRAEHWKKKTFR